MARWLAILLLAGCASGPILPPLTQTQSQSIVRDTIAFSPSPLTLDGDMPGIVTVSDSDCIFNPTCNVQPHPPAGLYVAQAPEKPMTFEVFALAYGSYTLPFSDSDGARGSLEVYAPRCSPDYSCPGIRKARR